MLEQEDRDGDYKVCITDIGPKVFALGTATSNGTKSFDVRRRGAAVHSVLKLWLAS